MIMARIVHGGLSEKILVLAQCAFIVHMCTLAFFSILVARIDSILHIMVVLNVSQHVVLVLVHA